MDRTIRLLALAAVSTGCPYDPNTVDPTEITTNASESSGATGESLSGPTDPSDATNPSTTIDPSAPDTGSTGEPAVCGDGELQGDEVCDDMVNDGSYGGCLDDCSDFADRCGDTEINGPEVCDDGTNDGAYGGCVEDCSALGPHCGDSQVNGPEGCDNGDANENGSGCNIDCIVSGSQIGVYDLGMLSFCDGVFVTRPAFRYNGTTVVAATGYCDNDTKALVELNADVTESQVFDDLLLPNTPVQESTTTGDAWVLSASSCNYVVSPMGALTEICEQRTAGNSALEADDDGNYVALDYDALALYPSGSPMLGDAPTWLVAPQDNGTFDYTFSAATFGASGSVAVVGYRRLISNNDYVGFVARYTAAGNLAGNFTFPAVEYFEDVVHAPDGTILAIANYPNYSVTKLDSNYQEEWSFPTGADSNIAATFDSTGALVLLFHDSATMAFRFLKRAPDTSTLWDETIDGVQYNFRIAADPADAIWIADASYRGDGAHLVVQKYAP